jgi:hypothetical protein
MAYPNTTNGKVEDCWSVGDEDAEVFVILDSPVTVQELNDWHASTDVINARTGESYSDSAEIAVEIFEAHFKVIKPTDVELPYLIKEQIVSTHYLAEGETDELLASDLPMTGTVDVKIRFDAGGVVKLTFKMPSNNNAREWKKARTRRRSSGASGISKPSNVFKTNFAIGKDMFVSADGYDDNDFKALPVHHVVRCVNTIMSAYTKTALTEGNF